MTREGLASVALFNSKMFLIFIISLEMLAMLKKEGDMLVFLCVRILVCVLGETWKRSIHDIIFYDL